MASTSLGLSERISTAPNDSKAAGMFAAQGLPGELQSLAPKVATLTARLICARTRLRHVLQVGVRGAAAYVNRLSDGPSPVANAKHSLPEYVAQPRT